MKRKILCIVLAVALAVSCFTLVQAADGDTLGGKVNAAFEGNGVMITSWTGKSDGSTPTNTAVNTPFKGIDFPDKDGVRKFRFAAYNDTDSALKISLSCSWGMQAVADLTTKERPKDYTDELGSSGGIESRGTRTFTIAVPNRAYWLNSGGTANGSEGKIVDGSGVGFRFDGQKNGTGAIYLVCVGGDSSVTQDDIAKINANIANLTFATSKNGAASTSAITDWNENEATKILHKARLGFFGVRYTVPAGTAGGYFKTVVPDLSAVSSTGEDTVTARLTVYNNSDKAILISVYPQAAWADVKGYSKEKVCLGAKTYYTYIISYTTQNGTVTNINNKQVSVYGSDIFYRIDAEYQPDIDCGANYANLQDIDITVMNASETLYQTYDKAQEVFVAPTDYAVADINLKVPMVMYNGDFEVARGLKRWTMMKDGSISVVESDNADGGNWSLKYTSDKSIYGSALFNVAPAVANFTAKDGIFNGGGAGFYKITFDAKADDKAVGTYQVRLESDFTGQHYVSSLSQVTFDKEWKTFTAVVEVKQDWLNKNYFELMEQNSNTTRDKISVVNTPIYLRFDGSYKDTGGLRNAATAPGTYWIDNVKIEKIEFNANIEASITLNDSLAWNLYGEGIDKVDVTFNGKTTTVNFENGKAVFDDIAAKMMADKITFKFYQTIGGKEFTKEITTSVKEYMEEIISGNYDEADKTLAIDTLNYGTATQVYDKYDVENLANAGLTDEQKVAYLSITKPVRDYGQTGEGFKFKAASLYLKDKVYIKMYIAKSDYKEGMTVRVNGTAELTEWKASGKYMYVMTDGISANELSNTVTAAVYENNTQVSTTLTYSAGTYAANKWDSNRAELASLVKALVKYGNSAAAYTE